MLVTQSSNLLNEAKTEKYKDLRALLQLLSNLCSKDLVGLSSICIHVIEREILLSVCWAFVNLVKRLHILQVDFSSDSIEAQATNISQVNSYRVLCRVS